MFVLFLAFGIAGLLLLTVALVFDGLLDFLDFDTPFLSAAAFGAFLSGFGFTGMLLNGVWAPLAAVAAGIGGGVILAGAAGWMTGALAGSRTDETVRGELVIGAIGTVVNRIEPGAYGEVSVTVAGHLMKYNAKSDELLQPGTQIVVLETLSPSAVWVSQL